MYRYYYNSTGQIQRRVKYTTTVVPVDTGEPYVDTEQQNDAETHQVDLTTNTLVAKSQ
jgi:hypothetical protein